MLLVTSCGRVTHGILWCALVIAGSFRLCRVPWPAVVACGYTGVTRFLDFQNPGNVGHPICSCVGAHHFGSFLVEGEMPSKYLTLLGIPPFLRPLPT